jgi:hypothetical protein
VPINLGQVLEQLLDIKRDPGPPKGARMSQEMRINREMHQF